MEGEIEREAGKTVSILASVFGFVLFVKVYFYFLGFIAFLSESYGGSPR